MSSGGDAMESALRRKIKILRKKNKRRKLKLKFMKEENERMRALLMAMQQNSTSEGAALSSCVGGLKGAIESIARDVSELKEKL